MRVGDLAQFERSMGNMLAAQSRVYEGNLHVNSGKRIHRYVELAENSSVLIRTEAMLAGTQTFVEQNEKLINRLNLMDSALADIKDMASELQNLLVARRNGVTGSAIELAQEAQGIADRVIGLLNLRVDGDFVFGGSRIDTQPVDAAQVFVDPANASYYQGDDIVTRARIDTSHEASYGVRADEQPFRDLFAAIKLARDGHQPEDAAMLEQASLLAGQALDSIIARRSELNVATARIEGIMESQEGTKLYLQNRVSQLTDTDVPATMAQIAQDQVVLEASYSLVAQLSRLNLTDYLR